MVIQSVFISYRKITAALNYDKNEGKKEIKKLIQMIEINQIYLEHAN